MGRHRHILRSCFFALVLLVSAAAALPAAATSRNWNNPAGGSAGTASNWTPAGVPAPADFLFFTLPGSYLVTIPSANVPTVFGHDYESGAKPTLSCDITHVVSNLFIVGDGSGSQAGVTITRGTFQTRDALLGVGPGSYGRLTLSPDPARTVHFEETDSTQGGSYGSAGGSARVEVLSGAYHSLAGEAMFASSPASRCTLLVIGTVPSSVTPSTFITTNPRLGDLTLGNFGQAILEIADNAFVSVGHDLSLGLQEDGFGTVRMWNTPNNLLTVGRNLNVGQTDIGILSGHGHFVLESGNVRVGGRTLIGDHSYIDMYGGTFVSNGLQVDTLSALNVHGGIFNLHGGTYFNPFFNGFTLSSTVGAPEFWVTKPIDNPPGLDTHVYIGRLGLGTMRVTQAGTVFGTTQECTLGDSVGGVGSVFADSGGTFKCGALVVGERGTGVLDVRRGSHAEVGSVSMGFNNGASGSVRVTGAGSTMQCASNMFVGNASTGFFHRATAVVDSSAVLTVLGSLNVGRDSSLLVISNGATAQAPTVIVDGRLELHAGTINNTSVTVNPAGSLGGRGFINGPLHSLNLVSLMEAPGTYGSLRVNGQFTNNNTGVLEVGLGRPGGPRNDTLIVNNANLNGILSLRGDPSFVTTPGDSFTVLTYAGRSGMFNQIRWNGFLATGMFTQVYLPNRLVLVKTALVAAPESHAVRALRFSVVGGVGSPEFALELPYDARVRIDLLDLSGRRVARVDEGALAAGEHRLALPRGVNLASGVYFAQATIEAGGRSEVRRVKVLRLQ